MNKRQLKKYKQKCIGQTLSLVYGKYERKFLAELYAVCPNYFEYFDKKRLRKVYYQIKHDSENPKYSFISPTDEKFPRFIGWAIHIIDDSEKFMKEYRHLLKEDKRYENTPYLKPSISFVCNYGF